MIDEMHDVIWVTRETNKPNDLKLWGCDVYNSTKYHNTAKLIERVEKMRHQWFSDTTERQKGRVEGRNNFADAVIEVMKGDL